MCAIHSRQESKHGGESLELSAITFTGKESWDIFYCSQNIFIFGTMSDQTGVPYYC